MRKPLALVAATALAALSTGQPARAAALHAQAHAPHASGAPAWAHHVHASCAHGGVDYSCLAKSDGDYAAQSTSYQNYEFAFNVCRQLNWSEGECVTGSSVCERLKSTKTATDVYGKFSTTTWGSDADGTYIEMAGDQCLFGAGAAMVRFGGCSNHALH